MPGGSIVERHVARLPSRVHVARPDPRVLRTHRALHEAMVNLCLETGYRAVTIDMLVERAGVTRATFYTHFRDKEHLLSAIADQVVVDVLDRFEQRLAEGGDGTDRLLVLFEDAERHPDRLRVVLRGEGDGVALRQFVRRVADVIDELDEAAALEGALPLAVDAQLAVHAMAGQITEVLRWWLDSDADGDTRLTREQVVAQLRTTATLGRLAADDPRRLAAREEEHHA